MTDFLDTLRTLLATLAEGHSRDALHDDWRRLLDALVGDSPAEASTLMVAEGDALRPVAVLGLDEEVLGRRFVLREHPRLAAIAAHPGVCRFPPDSPLPDPFDGLLDETLSEVHDCLGVALRDGDRLTGLLTLDALTPGSLDGLDERQLQAAAGLLGTCLRLADQLSAARFRLDDVLEEERRPLHRESRSAAMRRLDEAIALVAPTDMSVLLHGETGVGKERVVRTLHAQSKRRRGPLVQVNCATLPESLIESELFGHLRGAFSGAVRDHRGHFTMADGGTLMLDEIGELPLTLQPKLLRVLQEGEIQPLGSEHPQHVDVRIIAVTNRDLAREVEAGHFREDLYHRLSAFPLEVPPLRERREDIPLLAGHFLEDNRIRLGLANLRLSAQAEAALLAWHWPGNVRELEHTLARASLRALGEHGGTPLRRRAVLRVQQAHLQLPDTTVHRGEGQTMADHIEPVPHRTRPTPRSLRDATDAFQRALIADTLAEHGGNWAATARTLELDPGNLHRQARRLGLK
ncbi:nitric oxide reductase transcriptional regulator NorR [Litchfieldella xinjiangensis]|uniref:nitric oxide reductase transcriptional regulator NorR n=1 Tax=Litchfieldella xinjiangensis TaxID=1166948 RepID=UPI0005BDB8C1|nr:nitric oxide reductase transcriptional regulator NorR [Halomonas xinjiangensis]